MLRDVLEEIGYLFYGFEFEKAVVGSGRRGDAFVFPSEVIGYVDGGAAEVEDGEYVGLEGVANHEEGGGIDREATEEAVVGFDVFFRNDFGVFETVGEFGFRNFAFLVSEVTFGDEDEAVGLGEGFDGFGDAVEEFDGMAEHFLAEMDDAFEFFCRNRALREFDGCFDAGEHEALNAVAVVLEVSHLSGEERFFDGLGVVELGEELAVLSMVFFEEIFVVPEGVVGVEGDDGGSTHWAGRWREIWEEGSAKGERSGKGGSVLFSAHRWGDWKVRWDGGPEWKRLMTREGELGASVRGGEVCDYCL